MLWGEQWASLNYTWRKRCLTRAQRILSTFRVTLYIWLVNRPKTFLDIYSPHSFIQQALGSQDSVFHEGRDHSVSALFCVSLPCVAYTFIRFWESCKHHALVAQWVLINHLLPGTLVGLRHWEMNKSMVPTLLKFTMRKKDYQSVERCMLNYRLWCVQQRK
jgi:hypothetical protein